MTDSNPLTYRDAGVDIDAGNRLVDRIRPAVDTTRRPEVLGGIGGFGGLIEIPAGYRRPVLVAGTDGVGTKLLMGTRPEHHRGLGIDLVAMCVNDVIVQGAEPLLFLDYYATGRLNVDVAAAVVEGVAEGCRQSGAALLGGETAEMPGLYAEDHYDMAGFCVGVAERDALIDPAERIRAGDRLIALPSSGPHANGFSLIRRVIAESPAARDARDIDGFRDAVMAPTRIYAAALRAAQSVAPIHGAAHITGGGIIENLPRILPSDCAARVQTWEWPAVFRRIADWGRIREREMLRTFNCGIGMVLCVAPEHAEATVHALQAAGEPAWLFGTIEPRGDDGAPLHLPGEAPLDEPAS